MPDDLPGPPGSGDREDQPRGDRPTEPLSGGPPPSEPPTTPGPPAPPPPTPGDGQPGDGQPPPVTGSRPPRRRPATAALVIAVVGFFICAPVGAIVALVLANSSQKRIEASGGQLTGIEQARAARIIAIIELVLTGIAILIGVIAIIASMGNRY